MSCPSCGGTDREPIAPGWWRCTSRVTIAAPGPGLGAPPTGQFGPEHLEATAVCGRQYAERTGNEDHGPLCDCGTFAIGICKECGRDVCGECSVRSTDGRVHRSHVIERERTQRETREAATGTEAALVNEQAIRRADAHKQFLKTIEALRDARIPQPMKVKHLWSSVRKHQGPWRVWPLVEKQIGPPAEGAPKGERTLTAVTANGDLLTVYPDRSTFTGTQLGIPIHGGPHDLPWDELLSAARSFASSVGLTVSH